MPQECARFRSVRRWDKSPPPARRRYAILDCMSTPLEILQSYAEAFRDLVTARVWGASDSPVAVLRLKSSADWDFICVAMDIVEDAALAVGNFLCFSLDGPTRYEDFGERYLRLYGLLSATYIQQEAVLKLYVLMNCGSPKTVRAEFSRLGIRTLRHQVASHGVDYLPPAGGRTESFVPVRVSLSGFSCTVSEGRGNDERTVDLEEAIKSHCVCIVSVLDRIYEKSVQTIFRGQDRRIAEFNKKLDDLRFVRDGNLILRSQGVDTSLEMRVKFVDPSDGSMP